MNFKDIPIRIDPTIPRDRIGLEGPDGCMYFRVGESMKDENSTEIKFHCSVCGVITLFSFIVLEEPITPYCAACGYNKDRVKNKVKK